MIYICKTCVTKSAGGASKFNSLQTCTLLYRYTRTLNESLLLQKINHLFAT